MSTLTVKELAAPTGFDLKIASGETLDLNSQGTVVLPTVPTSKLGTGAVLQVVEGGQNGVSTHSAGNTTYSTIFSVTMSNVQSSSTILGFITFQGYRGSSNNHDYSFGVFRGSTSVGGGTAADGVHSLLMQNHRGPEASMSFQVNGQFADTGHGGGTLQYDAKVINEGTVTLGRPSQSGDVRHGRTRQTLILMEIAG